MRKFDLEDRLIDYTIIISEIVERFDKSILGYQIGKQLIRSSSSPALNYGEAQSAESRKDFIHKLKIIQKELKESRICLKIADRKPLSKDKKALSIALKETEELNAIIYKSIQTTKSNMSRNHHS